MKIKTKKHLQSLFRRIAAAFLLYAALPLLCMGILVCLLFVHSVGADKAESMVLQVGEKSIFAAVGLRLEERRAEHSYFFLSGDLSLPKNEESVTVGSVSYFSPDRTPLSEPQTEEKTPSQILYDAIPSGAVPVVQSDLSSPSYLLNSTKYQIDLSEARTATFPCLTEAMGEEPLVLILHTHGTESYLEDETNLSEFAQGDVETYYVKETSFRSNDPEKTVVAVGKAFAEVLNENSIPTLHCTVMHDAQDFNTAYEKSAETVKKLLKEYPSIQYVIDLHRDSVLRGDAAIKTHASELEGNTAQVMLVVGSNQNGRHPDWEKNLSVAVKWKDIMDRDYPSLSRSLYLRTARFNQEYTFGSLLLEVGTAANSQEEALAAARLAARSFLTMLQEN